MQVAEGDLDRVVPARRLRPVEEDVFRVLAAAAVLTRAVAVEVEPRRRRARVGSRHALVRRRHDREVHVGLRSAPRDGELQEAGLHAAPFVDDPVAVVVDRVEAELRARRRARLDQRRARGRLEVASPRNATQALWRAPSAHTTRRELEKKTGRREGLGTDPSFLPVSPSSFQPLLPECGTTDVGPACAATCRRQDPAAGRPAAARLPWATRGRSRPPSSGSSPRRTPVAPFRPGAPARCARP